MKNEKFSVRKRIRSFGYAFNGLKIMLKEEHNSRIHLFFTAIVVAFMLIFRFTLVEYALLVLAIGLVFMAELFNSALENLADHISPDRHINIKKVKDLSAAAVLVSALAAFAIGCLILGPKLINIWEFMRKI
ncbi:MAG: diacylglycerol kinase family protein [Prolixibacteraceae bacterium]